MSPTASGVLTPRPKCRVVMPAYNESELIEQTVKEVGRSASGSATVAFEMLVVENGSTDSTLTDAKAFAAD